jgi:hypothetical protein
VSRVSIITGLTRKEVKRALGLKGSEDPEHAERYNRAARVVAGWRRDPEFLGHMGKPVVLEMTGKLKSFQDLVKRYSGDIPYRAVLDELEADGSVERLNGDRVKLVERAYVPAVDESMKVHILGVDTALLIETIDHNLRSDRAQARFQRKVLYDNLPDEALPEFRRLSSEASQGLLEKLDRWLARNDRDSRTGVTGSGRNSAGIGIYYFEKPMPGPEKDPRGRPKGGESPSGRRQRGAGSKMQKGCAARPRRDSRAKD